MKHTAKFKYRYAIKRNQSFKNFNFEAELLTNYFQIAPEMKDKFGGWTGEMIITGENAEIIHHEKPA